MKNYSKPQIVAKNLPSGSYAAGCGVNERPDQCTIYKSAKSIWQGQKGWKEQCVNCERTM